MREGISIVEGWAPWSRADSSSWPEKHSQFEAAVIGTGVRLAAREIDAVARPTPALLPPEPFLRETRLHARPGFGGHYSRKWDEKGSSIVDSNVLEKFGDIFVYPRDTTGNLLRWIYELILEFFFFFFFWWCIILNFQKFVACNV